MAHQPATAEAPPAGPRRAVASHAMARAVGYTGLRQSGGWIREEFLPALKGRSAVRVYEEMAQNDAICGAVLFAIEMLIRRAEWRIQPADESDAAKAAADWLRGALLEDMATPWAEVITEILSMMTFGYALMEPVLKRRLGWEGPPEARSRFDDGLYGLAAIEPRAQQSIWRWVYGEDGRRLEAVEQRPETQPAVTIPIDRLLHFRPGGTKMNPEGRSILRTAYRSWYFKKRMEGIEAIGVERDLAGLPVMRVPSQMMADDAADEERAAFAAYQEMVARVRRDEKEGVILPSDRDPATGEPLFSFELMSSSGGRQLDTTRIIDRYDRRIAMATLAQFIFLGQQAVGSFALSSDQTALFATAVGGWLDSIAEPVNGRLIPTLWSVNGLPRALMPKAVPGDVETPNLGELGRYVTALAGAGAPLFPDRDLENHLRKAASLPPAPEEEGDGARDAVREPA